MGTPVVAVVQTAVGITGVISMLSTQVAFTALNLYTSASTAAITVDRMCEASIAFV